MSLGWPSSDFEGRRAIEAAIKRAYDKNVLMFAAASNSGGQRGRSYPASDPHVLCIHSTNALGDKSDFSPTAKDDTVNIATVGDPVRSAIITHSENGLIKYGMGCQSGTSYATAILAGIAAFLLLYARLHLDDGTALELKQKAKMEALLVRCAQHGQGYHPRDNYHYVRLSLEKDTLFGRDDVNPEILRALMPN